jgi:triosephosphate isomerase
MPKTKLIAANWKMNGSRQMAGELLSGLAGLAADSSLGTEVVICPPYPYLPQAVAALSSTRFDVGGQDCSERSDGAYTGDVSAAMLRDIGCAYVILGHSERREYHSEHDISVAGKIMAAHGAGLKVMLCVGEKDPAMSHEDRVDCLKIQICNSIPYSANAQNTVVAYEPVWAIGSGLTPTLKQISELHTSIRTQLPEAMRFGARILYGGSVKADNAHEILSLKEVDGALVGGASLKFSEFSAILESTR